MTSSDRGGGTLVITGASGFLGRQLVPLFADAGYDLLLCGRDLAALAQRFPGVPVCAVEDLSDRLDRGPHALLHLAVMNSDRDGTEAAFFQANVTYLEEVLRHARAVGVAHVIYPSSFHVQRAVQTPYAKSKAAAEALVAGCTDMRTTILRLPAVYGTSFQGRLAMLNRFKGPLRGLVFDALRSLRSTVDVRRVFDAMDRALRDEAAPVEIVADDQDDNRVYRFGKRLIDLAFVFAVVVFLWWLLALIWLAIRLTSAGPALFIQERVGRDRAIFRCCKFRTMHVGTAEVGTHDAPQQAITKVGAVLRRLKFDELPQVWNLLRGEMTLVGPRPCLPVQEALIAARAARNVFDLRPGVSGLAQVNGIDMSTPEALAEIDAVYAKTRTLVMDIKIILATLPGVSVPAEVKV
ncbi:MAG: sugar transferase [Pseudomonadota bacterium]